ncbi:MAG: tetratricopeptide repeat protein [candidate division WOR-3 bacterium]|nr:MAG: tetratricopeptide repeat protein [candidate division WOR-3 bacterium]
MNRHFCFLSVCCILVAVQQASPIREMTDYHGQYLGQDLPGHKPEPFAPDLFSVWNDYGLHPQSSVVIAPGGDKIYFTDESHPVVKGRSQSIWLIQQTSGAWIEPHITSFSSDYSDWGTFLSEEGRIIYFASTRPRPRGGKGPPGDADIWYVEENENGFSEPRRLGHPVNTAYGEVSGAVASNGVFLFSSNRPGGKGGFDIYLTEGVNGDCSEPVGLGEGVNTGADERVMCVSPDLSFLILHRYDRNVEADAGLYVSYRLEDHSWTEAKSVGDHINMLNATWASLSPDREYLFFLGLGHGVYWLKAGLADHLKKADLSISERLYQTLRDHGIESACAEYFEMKNRHGKYVELDEFFLNQKGYQLLEAGDVVRSIGIFRICVALFPASWNAHDSLAEAYLAAGKTEKAKTHYRRSLDLNPENDNARRRLDELEMN